MGRTLWTDLRLRIDDAGVAGQLMRQLSGRDRSMTVFTRYQADCATIRMDDPHTSNSHGTRRLVPTDTLPPHRRRRA
ncbi:hypothetical protein J2W35_004141 [Variovorax boronicumulans]|uniref:hypothetical protein n=1 Tax=Variovorax boronicumulans TaxID=436515 RepID=UPI002782EC20|nr:hypothetical protein [Variovorax boronicumulans]MDQ0083775.1 hypothetical protein [Variovorax boronicumulans]